MTKTTITIAIDGPAASGKTTVGFMLANHLHYLFLDTGCMYRAVTLAAMQQAVDVQNEAAVVALTRRLTIDIRPTDVYDGRMYTVLLDGRDVTWALRSTEVDAQVSQVSLYKGVREEMVRRQRAIGAEGGVIMVGRDIGTVVMPDAPLKLYIIASPAERARRRWLERQQRGDTVAYETILADVLRRDAIDSGREHSPMRPAGDAIIIDTTARLPETILEEILALVRPFVDRD
ncbi:MAG: (d)CMP kinase [Chloroflexota bacterium]